MAIAAIAAFAPTGVVFADAAGPTDYRTTIVSVSPDVGDAATFSVEGGDAFIRAVVAPGHQLAVEGYEGEAYIRIDPDGSVWENRASPSYYYNLERYGGDVPAAVSATGAARWVVVDDDGEHAWHDHRAHWMADQPPIGLTPGQRLPAQTIDVAVDGQPVQLTVATELRAEAGWWWWPVGTALGCLIAVVGLPGRRTEHGAPRRAGRAWEAAAVAGVGGCVVGVANTLAVPASTGRELSWWLLPAFAVATAIAAWATRHERRVASMLVCGAALELGWWVWPRLAGLLDAYRPTVLPMWIDRTVTVAVAVAALGVFARGLAGLFYGAEVPDVAGAVNADNSERS